MECVGFEQNLEMERTGKSKTHWWMGLENTCLLLAPHFPFVKWARVGQNELRLAYRGPGILTALHVLLMGVMLPQAAG